MKIILEIEEDIIICITDDIYIYVYKANMHIMTEPRHPAPQM